MPLKPKTSMSSFFAWILLLLLLLLLMLFLLSSWGEKRDMTPSLQSKVYFSYRDEGRHTLLPPPLLNTFVILSRHHCSSCHYCGGNILVWHNDHEQVLSLGTHRDNFFVLAKWWWWWYQWHDKQRKGNHQPMATPHTMSSMMLSSFSSLHSKRHDGDFVSFVKTKWLIN